MWAGDQKLMIDLEWPYESRDPGPYFPMKMVTWCPQFGGSLFSYDTGTNANGPGEPLILFPIWMVRGDIMGLIMGGGTIGRMIG